MSDSSREDRRVTAPMALRDTLANVYSALRRDGWSHESVRQILHAEMETFFIDNDPNAPVMHGGPGAMPEIGGIPEGPRLTVLKDETQSALRDELEKLEQ